MSVSKSLKILFVGGKTGGHIFPLLALASELQKDGHEVFFVTSGSVFENKYIQNIPTQVLKVGRLASGVSFLEKLKTVFLIPYFMIRSFFILKKINPNIVIGSGGSVSGPVLLVASLFNYRTALWEFNLNFGLTNRILSFFVDRIYVYFKESCQKTFQKKCFDFSLPVRESVSQVGSQKREPDGYFHILVLGGSQGARRINQLILEMYQQGLPENWKIIHQTGEVDCERIRSIYSRDEKIECLAFIENMGKHYQWADIVISRAGSGVLSELSACGKASLILPLQTSDHHQFVNADYFFKKGAIEKAIEKDLTGEKLIELLMSLNGKKKRQLEERIKNLYDHQSFQKMKQNLLSLSD